MADCFEFRLDHNGKELTTCIHVTASQMANAQRPLLKIRSLCRTSCIEIEKLHHDTKGPAVNNLEAELLVDLNLSHVQHSPAICLSSTARR